MSFYLILLIPRHFNTSFETNPKANFGTEAYVADVEKANERLDLP